MSNQPQLKIEKKRKQLHELYCENKKELRYLRTDDNFTEEELQDRIAHTEKFLEMLDRLIEYLLNLEQITISARKLENKEMKIRHELEL